MATVNELKVAITNSSTTPILLSNPCDFAASGIAQIESEYIQYTFAGDTQLVNITRGVGGTSGASHAAGKSVIFLASFPADVLLNNSAVILTGTGAPTNGLTGLGVAGEGSLFIQTSNGSVYSNTGSITNPTWTMFQSGSDLGITQLTGDVTAGPGNGSQAATLASTAVTPGSYTHTALTVDAKGRITAASNGSFPLTPAQVEPAASPISALNIDWSLSYTYSKTLGANSTFTFSNTTDGFTIIVALTNTASNWTVTWPAGIKWSGGTPPTQTVGAFTDVYTFVKIGSIIYGSAVQNLS